MANKSNHPLVKTFRAAATFCNDWRDTIFYTATLAGLAAVPHLHLGGAGLEAAIVRVACWREFTRILFWGPGRYQLSALTGINAIFVGLLVTDACTSSHPLQFFCDPGFVGELGLFSMIGGLACLHAGGPKAVYRAYRDTLFDYPRKIKPPTQRRKKKLSQAVRDLVEKIKNGVEGLLLQPVPQPVPIPVSVRRVAVNRQG